MYYYSQSSMVKNTKAISLSDLWTAIQTWDILMQVKIALTKFKFSLEGNQYKNLQFYKECIVYSFAKITPYLIKQPINNNQIVDLNISIKSLYRTIFSQRIFHKGKYTNQFQILMLLVVKVISQFYQEKFNLKEVPESQIFIVLNYTIIGIEIGANSYKKQVNKYIKGEFTQTCVEEVKQKIMTQNKSFKNKTHKNLTQKRLRKESILLKLQDIQHLKNIINPNGYKPRGSIFLRINKQTNKDLQTSKRFESQLKQHLNATHCQSFQRSKTNFVDSSFQKQIHFSSNIQSNNEKVRKRYIWSRQNSNALQSHLRLPQNLNNIKIKFKPEIDFKTKFPKQSTNYLLKNPNIAFEKTQNKKPRRQYNQWRQIIGKMKFKVVNSYRSKSNNQNNIQKVLFQQKNQKKSERFLKPAKRASQQVFTHQIQNNLTLDYKINENYFTDSSIKIENMKKKRPSKQLLSHFLRRNRNQFQRQCKNRKLVINESAFTIGNNYTGNIDQ